MLTRRPQPRHGSALMAVGRSGRMKFRTSTWALKCTDLGGPDRFRTSLCRGGRSTDATTSPDFLWMIRGSPVVLSGFCGSDDGPPGLLLKGFERPSLGTCGHQTAGLWSFFS